MLDALTLTALIEQCAPSQAATPLVAIVREASGFEPLVISTLQSGRPLSVQAYSKDEAVALAMEMRVAGQRTRLGLAGLDIRAVERLGLSVADAFEPCTNLRAASRLLKEDPSALQPLGKKAGVPSPPLVAATVRVAQPPALPSAPSDPEPARDQPPVARAWDVYGQARTSAALVYPTTE
jgi:hypothetical protein